MKLFISFLLLTFISTWHYTSSVDCKEFYYYFCPYDGFFVPRDAVTSNHNENTFIFYSQPLKLHTFLHIPLATLKDTTKAQKAEGGTLLCSPPMFHSAFSWEPTSKDVDALWRDRANSKKIEKINHVLLQGRISFITSNANDKNTNLNINCDLTGKEHDSFKISDPLWKNYSKNEKNELGDCVVGGNETSNFYVGLVNFQGDYYLTKIRDDVMWLQIVHPKHGLVTISYGRDVKILGGNSSATSFTWERLRGDIWFEVNRQSYRIYRCYNGREYLLTHDWQFCVAKDVDILFYKGKPFSINVGDIEMQKNLPNTHQISSDTIGKVECKFENYIDGAVVEEKQTLNGTLLKTAVESALYLSSMFYY